MGAAGTSAADSRPARSVGADRGGGSLITSDELSRAGGKTKSSPRPAAGGTGVARGGGVTLAFGVARGSGLGFGRGLGGGVERGSGSLIGWRGLLDGFFHRPRARLRADRWPRRGGGGERFDRLARLEEKIALALLLRGNLRRGDGHREKRKPEGDEESGRDTHGEKLMALTAEVQPDCAPARA